MKVHLTLAELEALLLIVSSDIEMCSLDEPDYEDVSLMEHYTSRASVYAKIKQTLEGLK